MGWCWKFVWKRSDKSTFSNVNKLNTIYAKCTPYNFCTAFISNNLNCWQVKTNRTIWNLESVNTPKSNIGSLKRKKTWPTSEYVSKKRKEFHGKRKLRTGDVEAFENKFVQFASESKSTAKQDTNQGKKNNIAE